MNGAQIINFPAKDLRAARRNVRRFKAQFPERWSALIRAHHDTVAEVAVFYSVTPSTAENWWYGVTGGSGAHVALAVDLYGSGFVTHMWPGRDAA